MAWPLYTTAVRPVAVNNAANTALYANGSQTHSFGTRVWVNTTAGTTPTAFTGSFTHLTQNRKANWEPADFDERDVSHSLSPYRHREKRASWGNPGQYSLEWNYSPTLMERQASLCPDPTVSDENHRYMIVEDPDGSVHQLYGFFNRPKKTHDVTANDNVCEQTFKSCGVDIYVKSA